jgi:predicted GNAT superfamily acetyltransferase
MSDAPSQTGAPLELRRVRTRDEYQACEALQIETWGERPGDIVGWSMLMVGQKVGGVCAGAFAADGALAGFVFGLTGPMEGRLVHWSDRLAVRPGTRDAGLGTRLKHFQRELVRPLGVRAIMWTFDPLVAKNAHLNLNRLGAHVHSFVPDMYGVRVGDLGGGLPTDRFIAEWDIDALPPSADDARPRAEDDAPVANPLNAEGRPRMIPLPDAPIVRVEIPREFNAMTMADPTSARAWRETTGRAFDEYLLQRGYRVRRLVRGERTYYVLAK